MAGLAWEMFPQVLDNFRNTDWTGEAFALSTPDRVIAALNLGMLHPRSPVRNEYGDGPTSVYPAMGSAYVGARENEDAWKALVDAGVVDALCQLVVGGVPWYRHPLPENAPELGKRIEAGGYFPPPWYDPLSVLFFYSVVIGHPATPTALKMISSLRKNWTKMMKRIWDEPDNSIEPTEQHRLERLMVGAIFDRVVECDPSFYSVTYPSSDRTLAVISRFWTYSTDPGVDININTLALIQLLIPEGGFGRYNIPLPHVAKFFAENPPPPRSLLLQHVLNGAQIPDSVANFLASLVSQFNLPGFNAENADKSMYLLISLYHSVFTEDQHTELLLDMLSLSDGGGNRAPETELLRALRVEPQPLWRALFAAAVKHIKQPNPQRVVFAIRVMDFVATVLRHSFMSSIATTSEEHCDILVTLIHAGLFQTLDDTISVVFTTANMHKRISSIFLFAYAASTNIHRGLEVESLLRAELPRPRILRATYDQWHNSGTPSISPSGQGNAPSSLEERKSPWKQMKSLEYHLLDPTVCGRRGCESKATARCTACKFGYCGRECQKTDWKEHKLVCGLKDNELDASTRSG